MLNRAVTLVFVLGCIVAESFAGYGLRPLPGYQSELGDEESKTYSVNRYSLPGYQSEFGDEESKTYSINRRGQDAIQFAKGHNSRLDEKNKGHQDAGYHSDVNGDHTHNDDSEKSFHNAYHGQQGKAEENLSNTAANNKGYSTTGFQDFHHKNEVGKKTSFYDSSDNAGGHHDYKTSEEVYGDKGVQGTHKDNQEEKYNEHAKGIKGSFGHDDTLEHTSYKGDLYDRKGHSGGDYDNEGYVHAKKHKVVKKPFFHPHMMKYYPRYPGGFRPLPHPHLGYY